MAVMDSEMGYQDGADVTTGVLIRGRGGRSMFSGTFLAVNLGAGPKQRNVSASGN